MYQSVSIKSWGDQSVSRKKNPKKTWGDQSVSREKNIKKTWGDQSVSRKKNPKKHGGISVSKCIKLAPGRGFW